MIRYCQNVFKIVFTLISRRNLLLVQHSQFQFTIQRSRFQFTFGSESFGPAFQFQFIVGSESAFRISNYCWSSVPGFNLLLILILNQRPRFQFTFGSVFRFQFTFDSKSAFRISIYFWFSVQISIYF